MRITNTNPATTKARLTSRMPHHLGKDAVVCDRPATTGKTEDIKNATAATTVRRRFHCGPMRSTVRLGITSSNYICAYLVETGVHEKREMLDLRNKGFVAKFRIRTDKVKSPCRSQ